MGTFVYFRHGPRTVGSEHLMGPELLELGLLGRPELRWRAFLLLCPKPMLGPETGASVRLKKGFAVIDGTGSHQKRRIERCCCWFSGGALSGDQYIGFRDKSDLEVV